MGTRKKLENHSSLPLSFTTGEKPTFYLLPYKNAQSVYCHHRVKHYTMKTYFHDNSNRK